MGEQEVLAWAVMLSMCVSHMEALWVMGSLCNSGYRVWHILCVGAVPQVDGIAVP